MKNYLLMICFITSILTFAQKIQVVSGNTDFLKDQKEINPLCILNNFGF